MFACIFLIFAKMKTKFYLIILIFTSLYSCKLQFDEMFDSVVIYNYGHSDVGVTYNVPVKFFFKKKEIATFHLYSFYSDLESGVYNYSDITVPAFQMVFAPQFKGENKTFFKGDCKWGDNIITEGSVTVEKQGENYTFIVDVIDNTGEHHYGKFSGKAKKEDWHTKSAHGLFNNVTIGEAFLHLDGYKVTAVQLDAGYKSVTLSVGVQIAKPENDNVFTGVYYFNESGWCSYTNYPEPTSGSWGVQFMPLSTGTITITRVDEPWRYRIDVDVVAKNGYKITGSFTKGEMDFFQGYDPEG